MRTERLLYDSHMHTPLCKHAVGEPEEYAATADRRGLRGIIVTCHNPIPGGWGSRVRMDCAELETYVAMVQRAAEAWIGRVDVRLGLESDFVPGMEPYLAELHEKAPFNFVLGSVHPQIAEYRERYFTGDAVAYQRTYFEHLAQAAETRLFDCLSHPDLVKNIAPSQWDVPRLLSHIRAALDRIARTGVAMELNTSGLNKAVEEMNPGPVILQEIACRGIPIVLGSDSHTPDRVGADFEGALDQLAATGFTHVSHYLNRVRHQTPIATARASLVKAG